MSTARHSSRGVTMSQQMGTRGNTRRRKDAGVSGEAGLNLPSSWLEFSRACDRWLVKHVEGYRIRNFKGQDVTDSVMPPPES